VLKTANVQMQWLVVDVQVVAGMRLKH
jgi:hypothetical protein